MSATIVVGAQWGDEGKGRVVDWLAQDADLVARFNGGDNAGHTIVAKGHTLKLHLVPSGILYPHVTCLIGAGVVVALDRLVTEIDDLAGIGIDVSPLRLRLSAAAHVVLPSHRALDGARENARGQEAIGTTRRGIGPAYADKAARVNLRAGDMADPAQFADRVAGRGSRHTTGAWKRDMALPLFRRMRLRPSTGNTPGVWRPTWLMAPPKSGRPWLPADEFCARAPRDCCSIWIMEPTRS